MLGEWDLRWAHPRGWEGPCAETKPRVEGGGIMCGDRPRPRPRPAKGRSGWCSWAALGVPTGGGLCKPSWSTPTAPFASPLPLSAHQRELTPLHYAAENGKLCVVELLVAKGAEVEAKGWVSEGTGWAEAPHPRRGPAF